jgi:hypothetical protein
MKAHGRKPIVHPEEGGKGEGKIGESNGKKGFTE